jgi:hypothetical protein
MFDKFQLKGKSLVSIRFLSMILLLISCFFQLIIAIIHFPNLSNLVFLVLFFILNLLIVIIFKIKSNIFDDRLWLFILFFSGFEILSIIILLCLKDVFKDIEWLFIISTSFILRLTNWNFSLSIFKKKKYIYFISGLVDSFLSFFLIMWQILFLLSFINFFIPFLGIVIIDWIMMRKELLNYI